MSTSQLVLALNQFKVDTPDAEFEIISNGFINDTYLVTTNKDKYVLQRINGNVFMQVEKLQANIDLAIKKLDHKNYSKIEFAKTGSGSSLAKVENNYWRLMTFLENSTTHNTTNDTEIAFEAGYIIGLFHKMLNNESVDNYPETIPNFHHLPTRKEQFYAALEKSATESRIKAEKEIDFISNNFSFFYAVYSLGLPQRVCHNDTKLNNILFKGKKALCLIDLDTIMQGYFLFDFGDAIRTIVNPAVEDENDLSKIDFNCSLFTTFVEGLKTSKLRLTKLEKETLALGPALMPFLHGTRALTDYLLGNIYYKVAYPDQNLDRARSLLHFSKLALDKQSELQEIVTSILNKKGIA